MNGGNLFLDGAIPTWTRTRSSILAKACHVSASPNLALPRWVDSLNQPIQPTLREPPPSRSPAHRPRAHKLVDEANVQLLQSSILGGFQVPCFLTFTQCIPLHLLLLIALNVVPLGQEEEKDVC